MTTQLTSYDNDRLQPALWPEEAKTDAVAFGANLTIAKGTVLAMDSADGKFYAYTDAGSYAVALGLAMYDFVTDADGNCYINGAAAAASLQNPPLLTLPMFVRGVFNPDDLTGLDANAVADFKGRYLHNGYLWIP